LILDTGAYGGEARLGDPVMGELSNAPASA
jgi:hypothetical protein